MSKSLTAVQDEGLYTCLCVSCGEQFVHPSKRAVTCPVCERKWELQCAVVSAALALLEAHRAWAGIVGESPLSLRLAKETDAFLFNLLMRSDELSEAMKK